MKKHILLVILLVSTLNYSQEKNKFYNFSMSDGKSYLSTMNQSNDLMLNSSRYIGNEINIKDLSEREKKIYRFSTSLFTALFGQAITHEYGHQSVLNELGIGSISKPFVDKNLVAKVTGVTDATLINLRNTDLSNYIRLHTAGLESDYAYLKKSDAFFNFNEEQFNVLYPDYLMRKLGVGFYHLSYLISSPDIKETDDAELNRDIVGHDIFGMVRHLNRPEMSFYRYTEWTDLTNDEQSYIKRMGYLSLLNFLNPNIWKGKGYKLTENTTGNFSVNYSLAPFGDFVEQNAYLTIKNKYKINPYFRQYFNKSYTFLAGGINLHNYCFNNDKFILNSSLDFWNQPKNLDFNTNKNEFGFGVKSDLGLRFTQWNQEKKSAYFNIGVSYKSNGFVPEAPSLKEDFRINFGFILSSKQ